MTYQPMQTTVVTSDWSVGLFDCFNDMNSCIDIWCCPSCAVCRQMDAADGISDSMNMMGFLGIFCFGCIAASIFNCVTRMNIANKYGIAENGCTTCLIATFCTGCGMCQQHRELTNRGVWPGGTICCDPPANYRPAATVVMMGQQPQYITQPPQYYVQPQVYYAPPPQQYTVYSPQVQMRTVTTYY